VKDRVFVVQKNGLAPGPVGDGGENLALTGISDRPGRTKSVYRLMVQQAQERTLRFRDSICFRSHRKHHVNVPNHLTSMLVVCQERNV